MNKDKVLNLRDIKVTDFRVIKEDAYDTIYEITFMAEPLIANEDSTSYKLPQIFYMTFNPYVDALDTMLLSDTSYIEAEDKDTWYDYRLLYADNDMLRTFEKILFALKVFRDTISMFDEEIDFIDTIHNEYIYGDMLEGNTYMTYLLNKFSLEAKDI